MPAHHKPYSKDQREAWDKKYAETTGIDTKQKYYLEHYEHIKAYQKAYREAHREKARQYQRDYYDTYIRKEKKDDCNND